MAGSPRYIELLSHIGTAGVQAGATWKALNLDWNKVEANPDEVNLKILAWTAFSILAVETQTPPLDLMEQATRLHIEKNAGYAGADNPDPWANFRLSTAFDVDPFRGVLVRLTDKYSRIQSLRRDPTNERIGESLLDTLRDLAAYALIAICLLEETPA